MEESVRIDKWLWSVRLYKTRNQATEACRAGKVKWNDHAVKPSRVVQPGDLYRVNNGPVIRTVKVISLLHNRVSAKLVPDYLEDLTPVEEFEKLQMMKELNYERWDRGAGRPTKKSRRLIDKLKGT
ncbi:MAG: S4 domain-containing protein [Bacteroidetes bacterium]|nr:S4 domain-containing protein [Bacteroidota bacterium]